MCKSRHSPASWIHKHWYKSEKINSNYWLENNEENNEWWNQKQYSFMDQLQNYCYFQRKTKNTLYKSFGTLLCLGLITYITYLGTWQMKKVNVMQHSITNNVRSRWAFLDEDLIRFWIVITWFEPWFSCPCFPLLPGLLLSSLIEKKERHQLHEISFNYC